MLRLLVRFTFFFHFPECITLVNVRHYGKVIERRRRRGRPLQRTATPRVTGQVAVQVTVTDRHVVLNQLAQNTAGNQRCAARCNHQHWVELRIDLLAQTTGHPHEAQHVQRHKRHEEADDPEPERAFTPGFVMEVRNQEQTVVQNEVSTWYRQQYAGHPTYGEGHDEADGPQHS